MDQAEIIDSTKLIVEGFRLQVLATQNARSAEDLLKLFIDKGNDQAYIVFEAPNYKVRVGNYIDRVSAEKKRKDLVKNGYPSSWIVRTRIKPIRN